MVRMSSRELFYINEEKREDGWIAETVDSV